MSASPETLDDGPVPVKPKVLKRFYESLLLCYTLGSNRGDHIAAEEIEEDRRMSDPNARLRRGFLNNLAYLCDYERGGRTVTSIALEQKPQVIIYQFASNVSASTRDLTKSFLEETLSSLQTLDALARDHIEEKLFTNSVAFSRKRIGDYIRQLKCKLRDVISYLHSPSSKEDRTFEAWLLKLEASLSSPKEACRFCFDERKSAEFNRLSDPNGTNEHKERSQFIRHIVGRLSHTMKAVHYLVEARLAQPKWISSFQVQRVPGAHAMSPPLQERYANRFALQSIVNKLVTEDENIPGTSHFKAALHDLDRDGHLSKKLYEQCISPTWRPNVHAELILLDFFWTRKLAFVDNDKFIGCSKSACYCCHLYITEHPGGFAIPSGHNNVWLNWRAPGIFDAGRNDLITARQRILISMSKHIKEKVLEQIHQQQVPREKKPDTLTIISSIRHLQSAESEPVMPVQVIENDLDAADEDSLGSDSCDRGSERGLGDESDYEESSDSDAGVSLLIPYHGD